MISLTRHVLIPVVFLLICIRKYRESTWGKCKNKVKLDGKLAIVTGANSGIGYQIAKELASRGAHVIMACRNLGRAATAVRKIKQELSCSSIIIPMELDLESVDSILLFVDEIEATYSSVHILVNNAGVSHPSSTRCKTKHGFEIHFGVNYLGHFILTNLLMGLLDRETSRIIVISSLMHERGKIYLDDLNLERTISKTDPYANSKLANIYFCKELARRTEGRPISVYAVCPGWVYTNLFRHQNLKWYQILLSLPFAFLFMRTPTQGAQTAIYCATEPDLKNGQVYRDCKEYRSKVNFDQGVSKKLWEISRDFVKTIHSNVKLWDLYGSSFL
ncbi:hypothetical protein PPYR_14677 [Photinus pyralis]|uniref:Uncharacterized protein n=1 Tax=Photinus pyralis TaxID=7054 RepID=A0A1Y1MH66_PHOPY|nr:retinol dehydrogenase 14-like [Photinus pyralis]KAB0792718.1 hypothetical protein PPYR_14677 [Photinus pyralis]